MADWSPLADAVDVTVVREYIADRDRLVELVGECEIVVIMRERTPFPAELFDRLPRLRLLVTTGMRNASVDLAAAERHGVTVCGTFSRSQPTVEHTWALLLGLARNLPRENAAVRDGGPWQSTIGADLHGRRLGLVGLGKIGSRVAAVGAAFGMDVVAWSPHLTDERAAAGGATRAASLDELLATSDFVSLHLVLSDRTRGLLGEAELRRMRPTARLVNTSRAALVDQTALARALREGWIAGAAVDVYDAEPLPADHEFRTLPGLLATPHLGYVTEATYRTFYGEAVADIVAFLAGEPVRVLGG
ncbi:D-2-hydroxyacid dehydrogenase family protein [Streptomyces hainanensis]|uniref:D-2-hydroxyacid dehydrogenase family protein n=1 Tax=Streptomyces hainanensis TaxID=402648 RepID=A0A4R4SU58_9ACTN|nr:D-2-hydroxyacid dehydrogenase family protein [Streptomyces hainanensis]TDC67631.1 D-2-hydroxyacid dehydrogenase family protein [Streptomyces hainanensis]